jgi:hypothetical protein
MQFEKERGLQTNKTEQFSARMDEKEHRYEEEHTSTHMKETDIDY